MHHCCKSGHENNLEKRGADNNFCRHAKDIDHRGHQNKATANTHDRGQNTDQRSYDKRRNRADIQVRRAKPHFERKTMHPSMTFNLFRRTGLLGTTDRAEALDEHQTANNAKKDYVGQRNQQVDLPDFFQVFKDLNTHRRAEQTAQQQDRAHLEVNGLLFHVRQNAGERRGHNLVRLGRNGNSRRNSDEEQQRGH